MVETEVEGVPLFAKVNEVEKDILSEETSKSVGGVIVISAVKLVPDTVKDCDAKPPNVVQ